MLLVKVKKMLTCICYFYACYFFIIFDCAIGIFFAQDALEYVNVMEFKMEKKINKNINT